MEQLHQFWVHKSGRRVSGPWPTEDCATKFVDRETSRYNSNYFEYTIHEEPIEKKQDSKIAYAAKKVPLMMIAARALFGVARVFGYGRKKHGAGNYLLAKLSDGAGERYMGALYRHAAEMQNLDGTFDPKSLAATDEESGLPHLDHLIATAVMLRAILIREGVLKADPGEGNEPPKNA